MGQRDSASRGNKASLSHEGAISEPSAVDARLRYVGREVIPVELVEEPAWADIIRLRAPEAMSRLAASIGAQGQLTAIKVLRRPDGTFIVWDGISRLRAAEALGLSHVKAEFYEGDVSEAELFWLALEMARTQQALGPVSKARLIRYLRKEHGLSHAKACRLVGVSPDWGYKLLKLLELPPEAQEAVEAGKLGPKEALGLTGKPHTVPGTVCGPASSRPEEAETAAEYNAHSLEAAWRGVARAEPLGQKPRYCEACGKPIGQGRPSWAPFHHSCRSLAREVLRAGVWQAEEGQGRVVLRCPACLSPVLIAERSGSRWRAKRPTLDAERELVRKAQAVRFLSAAEAMGLGRYPPEAVLAYLTLEPAFWELAAHAAAKAAPAFRTPKEACVWLARAWDRYVELVGWPQLKGIVAEELWAYGLPDSPELAAEFTAMAAQGEASTSGSQEPPA